ncbi:hypothetical protein [uncultured Anaerococcus sp.]|uniref:hypothetical protein n=1 Tax=uncultured Anaerococcus sp. TaxID=293428 RepID=UPI002804FADD|nr:hypothetical protein [uncultured Anaerococcus sp.]
MKIKLMFAEKDSEEIEEIVVIDDFIEFWINDLDGSFTIRGELNMPSKYVVKSDHEGFLSADSEKFYGVMAIENDKENQE